MLTQHTTAATLLARFQAVRSATMDFCSPLTPEDLMVQSCAVRGVDPERLVLALDSFNLLVLVDLEFEMLYGATIVFQGFRACRFAARSGHRKVADFHPLRRGEK